MKAVQIKGVKFKYQQGKNWALNEIEFSIDEGEAVAITGRSGAGKSSLLFCLNRIIPNFYQGDFLGEIEIFSQSIADKQTYQLADKIGLVLQDFESQLFSTRAELDVAFGPENLGLPREEISRRIEASLKAVGMENFRKREPESLSGGEKQRLAIASVLALAPAIVLFDEATTDLDPIGRAQVREVIQRLKEEGKTVILVDYEPEDLLLADRIFILEQGKLIADEKAKNIFSQPDLQIQNGVRPLEMAELFKNLNLETLELAPEQAGIKLRKKGYQLNSQVLEKLKKEDEEKDKKRGEILIQVENLTHIYPNGNQALSGIDLEVREGDFLAIIGQNGSGKTTLVKHLNALLSPSKGRVVFKNKLIKPEMISELGKEIGYVFQNPDHQIFCHRVYDEVAFGPRNYGFSETEIKKRVEQALDLVGLTGREDENPFLMTKGERQRLAIASILSAGPRVLILDEPTTGLDYLEQQKVMNLLQTLHQQGHTIIIITHTLWLVARYASRAMVMARGKKILEGSVRQVLSQQEKIKTASLIPPEITRFGLEMGFGFLKVEEALQALERNR